MLKFSEILNFLEKNPILKEFERFEWFEWFEWFGPSPIEPFNPGRGGVGGGREGVCAAGRGPGGRALQAGRESVEVGGGNRSERKLGKHWHSGTKRIKNRNVLSPRTSLQ